MGFGVGAPARAVGVDRGLSLDEGPPHLLVRVQKLASRDDLLSSEYDIE